MLEKVSDYKNDSFMSCEKMVYDKKKYISRMLERLICLEKNSKLFPRSLERIVYGSKNGLQILIFFMLLKRLH
jgi:hypothetical protein